jgi:hypothetical protein
MAQTLARLTCGTNPAVTLTTGCSQILSTDVIYNPIWTTGIALPNGEVDTAIALTYSGTNGVGGLNESPPTSTDGSCAPWTAQCRITIHYANAALMSQPFLQAIWNLASRTSPSGAVATCTNCHNTLSTQSVVQVPAGQLDLTGGASQVDPTIVTSYEDVVFPHDEQTLNMGLLQNVLVPGANGAQVPVQLAAVMTAGSANASEASFFAKFDGTDHGVTVDHTGYLTIGELRLISEWLDIGAQYYNDPFVAPAAN